MRAAAGRLSGVAQPGTKPSVELARQLLERPNVLPVRLVALAVGRLADGATERARELADRGGVEEQAKAVVSGHVKAAAIEGAAVGAGLTWVEATSVVGSAGVLTLPAAVTGLVADLVALAWLQCRMVLELAAVHGADMSDHAALRRDLLTLLDAEAATARSAGKGARQAISTLVRLVGLRPRFRLAGRLIPFANIALTARANATVTRTLGQKARAYYAQRQAPAVPSSP